MDGGQAARARGGLRARAHGLRQGRQPAGDGAHRPLRPDDASAFLAPGAQPAGQSVRVPLRPTERRRRPRGQVSGDLFGKAEPVAPLADALRPKSLDEVVGQEHLIGPGKPLRLAFESGRPHSMILWGPPGSGKTTIARLMAKAFNAEFVALSAVFSGVKDIRDAVAAAQARLEQFGRRTILFVDEVHRFNKAQQDAFLPFVEQGLITFVGATTENPSFEVNSALLSRAAVYVLQPLSDAELTQLFERARDEALTGLAFSDDATKLLVGYADGDARRLLNMLEQMGTAAESSDR